jgi:phosphoglycerol transferase
MLGLLAPAVFLLCTSFAAVLAWTAFGAPFSFPLSAIALALALLRLGRSRRRPFWKSMLLYLAVVIVIMLNNGLTEAYYLTGAGFAESFFYHLRLDLLFAGLGEHVLLIVLALLLFAIALLSFGFAINVPPPESPPMLTRVAVLLTISLWSPFIGLASYFGDAAAYSRPDGIVAQALAGPDGSTVATAPLPESLRAADAVGFDEPRNLVLFYGESLEQSYFDEPEFSALTGRLRAIRDGSLHFAEIFPGYSGDWTVAGLVASQCGYPLINDPLVNLALAPPLLPVSRPILPSAVCLGDVLAANGYRVVFVGGADTRFAGKGDFLARHGFDEILGAHEIAGYLESHPEVDPHPAISPWGYQDSTVLKVVQHRFGDLATAGGAFALFVLTIDTHHPNGLPSPGCATEEGDPMRDAIRCTADHLADFIETVRAGRLAPDALIGVVSDHLAHRTSQMPLLPSREKRRLTFFVNGPGLDAGRDATPGTMLDVPATLIDLLGGGAVPLGAGVSLLRGPGFLHRNRLDADQKRYFLAPAMTSRLREMWAEPAAGNGRASR